MTIRQRKYQEPRNKSWHSLCLPTIELALGAWKDSGYIVEYTRDAVIAVEENTSKKYLICWKSHDRITYRYEVATAFGNAAKLGLVRG